MNINKHNLYENEFVVYQSGNLIDGHFEELKVAVINSIYKYDVFNQKNKDLWYFEMVRDCPWINGRLITLPETRIVLNEDLLDIYKTEFNTSRTINNISNSWKFYDETKKRLCEYVRTNRGVLKRV